MNWIDIAAIVVALYAIGAIVALYFFHKIFTWVSRSFESNQNKKPPFFDLFEHKE
jgi:hypothetical protein